MYSLEAEQSHICQHRVFRYHQWGAADWEANRGGGIYSASDIDSRDGQSEADWFDTFVRGEALVKLTVKRDAVKHTICTPSLTVTTRSIPPSPE